MKKYNCILFFIIFYPFVVSSQVIVKTLKGPTKWPTSVVLSNDGKKLYVGSYDRLVWVFDIASSKVLDTLKFHTGPITSIDVSVNGILATASWDKQIALWEEEKNQPLIVLRGHQDKINFIRFSPDGKKLASVGNDGKLILWDAVTGGIIKQIEAHLEPATSLCFSSDGNIVVTTSWDKTVKLWNVKSGELISELIGHRKATNSVNFSLNNEFIVSGSDDNSMILWKVNSNKILKKFDFYKNPVFHTFFINNNDQIISLDQQGEIKVYNTNNNQLISVKNAHIGRIKGYVWSQTMNMLVTVGQDLNIHLWDMSEFTYYECMKKKTAGLESQRKPKSEFETTEQYEKRLANYDKQLLLLIEECKKEAIIEQKALEMMKLENDAKAFSWVNLNLTGIGNYNADAAEYPVMIAGNTYIIYMQLEDAISFKDNWQNAIVRAVRKDLGNNVFEYYNMEMEHPISKRNFMFGEFLTARSDPAFKIFLEKTSD